MEPDKAPVEEPTPTPPPEPVKIENKSKPKTPVIGLLVVLLILALGAVGFLGYQNMQLQKQVAGIQSNYPIPSPVIYASPSPVADETANWKVYTDSVDKIEFKYPQSWYAQPSGGTVPLIQSQVFLDDHSFEIPSATEFSTPIQTFFALSSETDINMSAKRLKETVYGTSVTETDNLVIGGNKAIQLSGVAGPGELQGMFFKNTLIQFGNKVLIVDLNDKNFENIYDQILSTLKFTN